MNVKRIILFFAAALGLLTSCVENLNEPNDVNNLLSGVEAQVEAMQKSAEDMKALNEALGECGVDVADAEKAISQHLASIKKGASLETATLATLELQKKIAAVVGAAEGAVLFEEGYAKNFKKLFEDANSGIAMWLGESFSAYYQVAVAQAKIDFVLGDLNPQIEDQQMYVDAIMSDIEAGLRKDENPAEITELAVSVKKMSQESEDLASGLASLAEEVDAEYKAAMKSMFSDQSSYDITTLVELNATVATKASAAATTLNGLAERVDACENQLKDISDRLGDLEVEVEALLDLIQSVTFISEYSEEYAVAYYEMDVDTKVSDLSKPYNGKAKRTAVKTIELNYMVRPAAAATALTKENVTVTGYYANQIQTRAIDPTKFAEFTVESVSVTNETRGIVTVRVNHNLSDEFYYKEIGAKCALSVATGKTDVTSKFVELYPVDNSGTVYVKSLVPSKDVVEIKKGETMTLEAAINPSNASNKAIYWASTDTKIVRIDETTGNLQAYGVGTADVQVISRGTDEWGLPVVGTCKVVVTEAVTLSGPAYVEVGKTADLSLDFPSDMLVESKVWWTSEEEKATVAEGTVTGVADTYLPYNYDYGTITVYCMINGEITVSHDMKVVVPQPRQIRFNNYADDVNIISMKSEQSISLAATILPDEAADKFRMFYESTAGHLGWINSSTGVINENSTTLDVGSYYVYAKVFENDKNHYFAPGNSLSRTIVVNVEPYYVQTITFADVKLQPNGTATLEPTFTSDVVGKTPTNTSLTWESNYPNIVSVDQKGNITALAEGEVIITATAKDGSGVSGTCRVTVEAPWKEFKIGDYVVRKSNGEIEFFSSSTEATNNGSVVGVVIYKGNPRTSDAKLPETCTHGIAIGLGEFVSKWWSTSSNIQPYHLKGYTESAQYNTEGYVSPCGVSGNFTSPTINDLGKKPYGYNNTQLLKSFYTKKTNNDNTTDLITKLNQYNDDANNKTPNNASDWYFPSIFEMYEVYKANTELGNLNDILRAVSGSTLANNSSYPYFTLSEHDDSPSSYAAAVNPITGTIYGKFKSTTSTYWRYFFAF